MVKQVIGIRQMLPSVLEYRYNTVMLNVYAATWCPHCQATVRYLEEKGIPFNYIDIEQAADNVVQKVVDVNGGDDWVVPTLEYNGQWREGKVFNEQELDADLKTMGVI